MKITVNIECSPEEARAYMGLPDVQPIQEALMKDLENRLRANMQAMDPGSVMRAWLPAGMQGVEQIQKMFWSQLQESLTGITQTASQAMTSLSDRKARE